MKFIDDTLILAVIFLIGFLVIDQIDKSFDHYNDEQSTIDYEYFKSLDPEVREIYFNSLQEI